MNESSSTATFTESFKFISYALDDELAMDSIYTSDESSSFEKTEPKLDSNNNKENANSIDDYESYKTNLGLATLVNEDIIQELLNRQAKSNEILSSTRINTVSECELLSARFDSSVFITDTTDTLVYDELRTIVSHLPPGQFFETEIIKNDTICIQSSLAGNYENLVEAPYKKRDELATPSHASLAAHKKKPLAGASTSSCSNKHLTKSTVLEYINKLKETGPVATTSTGRTSEENSEDSDAETGRFKYEPGKSDRCVEETIRVVREKLFSLLMTNLETVVKSEAKLKEFRDYFVYLLRKYEQRALVNNVESFVQEAFQFFNNRLFCKLLSSVNIEWSNRLKS